jgi:hypothetical protein
MLVFVLEGLGGHVHVYVLYRQGWPKACINVYIRYIHRILA